EREQLFERAHASHAVADHDEAALLGRTAHELQSLAAQLDAAVAYTHWPDRDEFLRILETAPGRQVEMMLVERRRDDELPLQVADDSPRQHARAADRIAVVDREAAGGRPEDRDLIAVHHRADAGLHQDFVVGADVAPDAVRRLHGTRAPSRCSMRSAA